MQVGVFISPSIAEYAIVCSTYRRAKYVIYNYEIAPIRYKNSVHCVLLQTYLSRDEYYLPSVRGWADFVWFYRICSTQSLCSFVAYNAIELECFTLQECGVVTSSFVAPPGVASWQKSAAVSVMPSTTTLTSSFSSTSTTYGHALDILSKPDSISRDHPQFDCHVSYTTPALSGVMTIRTIVRVTDPVNTSRSLFCVPPVVRCLVVRCTVHPIKRINVQLLDRSLMFFMY